MSYTGGRKNSARDGETSGRATGKENPMPVEPTIDELVEARECTDAGLRLAFPQLFERAAPAPEPDIEVDTETASKVGADLAEARQKLIDAGMHLDLEGNVDLHLRLNALVNDIDRFGAVLAERHSS